MYMVQAQWLTCVIPALWETEAGRLSEVSLTNMMKPITTKTTKISQVWWCTPVVPATGEAEAQESLETRKQRLE